MVTRILSVLALLLVVTAIVLGSLRTLHDRQIERLWETLRLPSGTALYDPKSVADLPVPAQRYFRHAIAPGTRLARSVVVEMQGRIGLKPGADKLPFQASQILAVPNGLIWKATVGEGIMQISGSDRYVAGEGAMHWFMGYAIPLVRASGVDVSRSAAGRVALEAPLLLPSALLPEAGARWEAIDARSARVHLQVGSEQLALQIVVASDGRLERVEMPRWDAEGLDGKPGYVLWIGDQLTEERTFGGYTIPVRMRATKRAGTPRADSFFEAEIKSAQYQ
ncbi:MAG TPA: DUF6544 family protein [Acidiferrobacterales bacterium]|nr:DUF6544 family protein [Acidiferrobacterales bacterium]